METFLGHVAVKIFISLDYFYKMVDSDISKILSKVPKCKETFWYIELFKKTTEYYLENIKIFT